MPTGGVAGVLSVLLLLGQAGLSQEPRSLPDPIVPPPKDVEKRLAEMEKRMKALLEELQAVRKELSDRDEMVTKIIPVGPPNNARDMLKALKTVYRPPKKYRLRLDALPEVGLLVVTGQKETVEEVVHFLRFVQVEGPDAAKTPPAIKGVDPSAVEKAAKAYRKSQKK